MRVGGYVRLSRDEDKENYSSILSQKSIIEECARQNHWIVESYYEDDNCSGYTFDRPGLNALLRDLESGKLDIVIAKDLSRIGRHNALTLLFIDRIKQLGRRLVLPKEGGGYDTSLDESDLLGIKTWYNEMYVKDISRKIKSSIMAKQKEGRMIVKEYFGYKRSNTDKHKLEVDLEAAETVRLIYRLYLSGLGYRKIAEALNKEGYPTPLQQAKHRYDKHDTAYISCEAGKWNASAVQRILSNDVYIGTLRLGKTEKAVIKGKSINKPMSRQHVFEENHPPIITREEFYAVQDMLKQRKRTGSKGAASKDNIFSGLLFCKDCGSYMIAYNKAGKSKSYICGNYHRHGKSACQRHSINENALELLLKEYLKTVAEAFCLELRNTLVKRAETELVDKNKLCNSLIQERSALKEKYKMLILQRVTEMQRNNGSQLKSLIKQSFDELQQELLGRMQYLEKRIDELGLELDFKSINEETDALQLFYRIIDKHRLTGRDAAILIEKIIIDRDGTPAIYFKSDSESICKHIREDVSLVPDR